MVKQSYRLGLALAAGLLVVIGLAAHVPLTAQAVTPTADPENVVLITGAVDLSQGNVRVNNFVLISVSGLIPVGLEQGDFVVVLGNLLPGTNTVEVIFFEWLDAPDVTPTPESTAIPTDEADDCNRPDHPAAEVIAERFDVPYDEVIGWHCDGFGFGEITRAYVLAETTGETADSYLERRRGGEGWGQIIRESGVHPRDLAPGQVRRGGESDDDMTTPQPGRGRDQGQGNGHGRP
ncbi:MAG: hypothetical protein IAE80_10440 [Anaerolinea sp.]|nr:hypothetical protein [Anaerolinea sp.]